MCGIFAYLGDADPDPRLLAQAAEGAARRGPHGHGWWADGTIARDLGPLDPASVPTARRIVGHARLATIGRTDRTGLQPVIAGGHVLVHNGNVYNWRELDPAVATDSFALAAVYARHRQARNAPREALGKALADSQQRSWAVIVLDATGVLVASRGRLPLHAVARAGGVYLSSGPLPGSRLIPEGPEGETWHAPAD